MRKALKALVGRRSRYRATVKKFGSARDPLRPWIRSVLFVNVYDERGDYVADHIWFRVTGEIRRISLHPGDEVFFTARVKKYHKRNPNAVDADDPAFIEDYRLSSPTKVGVLGAQQNAPTPFFDGCEYEGD